MAETLSHSSICAMMIMSSSANYHWLTASFGDFWVHETLLFCVQFTCNSNVTFNQWQSAVGEDIIATAHVELCCRISAPIRQRSILGKVGHWRDPGRMYSSVTEHILCRQKVPRQNWFHSFPMMVDLLYQQTSTWVLETSSMLEQEVVGENGSVLAQLKAISGAQGGQCEAGGASILAQGSISYYHNPCGVGIKV